MIPLSNIHTHTTFSDGRDTAEEMVSRALALGFHTLGFSDHGFCVHDDGCMSPEAEAAYRAEVLRLRGQYSGSIGILLGYEHDALGPWPEHPYDYVIESVHFVRKGGEVWAVDYSRHRFEAALRDIYGGDVYAMCRDYFRAVCESCASPAGILGHMDLVTKFNEARDLFDDADPRYIRCAMEAADCAADSGKLIEVNSGAVARGYRTQPYPGEAILRRLAQRRAPVIVTSDCHDRRYLDCNFAGSVALLRACGFKSACQYHGNTLEEYAL